MDIITTAILATIGVIVALIIIVLFLLILPYLILFGVAFGITLYIGYVLLGWPDAIVVPIMSGVIGMLCKLAIDIVKDVKERRERRERNLK